MRSTLVEIDNYICAYISAAVLTYHLNDLSAGSSEPKWGGRDLHSGPWKERSAFFIGSVRSSLHHHVQLETKKDSPSNTQSMSQSLRTATKTESF